MKMATLAEITAELESGSRPRSGITEKEEVPSIGGEQISADGNLRRDKLRFITFDAFNKIKGGKLRSGDILIVKDGATTGKTAFYSEQLPYSKVALNEHVFRLSVNREKAEPRFCYWYLRSPRGQGEIAKDFRGATVGGISKKFIEKVQVPLPPLPEQKRIAGVLDAADALRAKRRESLAQLDTLLQSIFLDMFGETGEPASIGELLECGALRLHKDGNHGSLYPRAEEFGVMGVPFLSAKCITDEGSLLPSEVQFLNEEKARRLRIGWIEVGDVLLAHNASVGKTYLYRGEFDEALIGTSLTAFRPDPAVLNSAYLLGALRSPEFQRQLFSNMGQTTRNQVPITAQRRLSIPIPSIALQRHFATIVESIERQKARMRAHLGELDALFASLQSRAFTGAL